MKTGEVFQHDIRAALDQVATILITDRSGSITYVNNKFCELSQYSREELIGQNPRILKSGHHSKEFYVHMWKTLLDGQIWKGEVMDKAKNGQALWMETVIVPLLNTERKPYQFVSYRTDMTARKLAEEASAKLAQTRNELELKKIALKLRDEFVSMASHELKTPLTALTLRLGMLKRLLPSTDEALSPAILKLVDESAHEVRRATAMIDDMLDVSKIKSGRLEIVREWMDLHDLITGLLERYKEEFRRAGCDLRFRSCGASMGQWDRTKIEQVITNLITNALKYGRGKLIEVTLSVDRSIAKVEIKDHGIGIPEEFRNHLFDRFERSGISKNFKGIGLGLWIANQIMRSHGGCILVESQVGAGTKFTVQLPQLNQ